MKTNNPIDTAIQAFLVAITLGIIVGIPKLIIFLVKKATNKTKKNNKTKKK